MFKLNPARINPSVDNNQKQGGINMNNVNNTQLEAALEQMKQELIADVTATIITRIDAIKSTLAPVTEPVEQPVVDEKEDALIFEEIANLSAPKPVGHIEGFVADGGLGVTPETQEQSSDSMFVMKKTEIPAEDLLAQCEAMFADDAQAKLVADALDFMDNPEAHEDAVIETEEEEEAPAPEELEDKTIAHLKEVLPTIEIKSIHDELDEEEEEDRIDIYFDMTEESEKDPFADIHIPTKAEKREQAKEMEVKFGGFVLNQALIQQQNSTPVEEPVTYETAKSAVISGPINQDLLYNSGRVSHKHNTDEFIQYMEHYLTRSCITMYEAGVREFRLPEFNGVELLMAKVWPTFASQYKDAYLVLYTNELSEFQQYKGLKDEEATGVFSPKRLQLILRDLALHVVKVKGNAFKVRREMAEGADAYIRVIPTGREDAANSLTKTEQLGLMVCPWSFEVLKTGAFEPKLIPSPGVDFRPVAYRKPVATV